MDEPAHIADVHSEVGLAEHAEQWGLCEVRQRWPNLESSLKRAAHHRRRFSCDAFK
jgi:hypothetical protein